MPVKLSTATEPFSVSATNTGPRPPPPSPGPPPSAHWPPGPLAARSSPPAARLGIGICMYLFTVGAGRLLAPP